MDQDTEERRGEQRDLSATRALVGRSDFARLFPHQADAIVNRATEKAPAEAGALRR